MNENFEVILKLNQQRFFVNGSSPDETENHLWKIPIKIITKSSYPNVHRDFLFEKRNDEINLGQIESTDWIKLNKNSIGIYRTQYSKEMLDNLIEPVKNKSIHPTDRLGLQDDVFNLVGCSNKQSKNFLYFFIFSRLKLVFYQPLMFYTLSNLIKKKMRLQFGKAYWQILEIYIGYCLKLIFMKDLLNMLKNF